MDHESRLISLDILAESCYAHSDLAYHITVLSYNLVLGGRGVPVSVFDDGGNRGAGTLFVLTCALLEAIDVRDQSNGENKEH